MAEVEGDYPTSEKVLRLLGIGAFLALSIVAPGLPLIFAPKYKRDYKKWKKFDPNRLKQTVNRLKERGFITTSEKEGQIVVEITKEGRKQILKYDLEEMEIKVPNRWDGKWRFVIFDIPNKKKIARDLFRKKLKELGFFHLQRSVFVHPFPCQKEIRFLRTVWEIEPYVFFFIAGYLEDDKWLRSKFSRFGIF